MKKNWLLKLYILFCGSMLATSLFAQGLLIEKKDGSSIKVPYELLERVTVYDAELTLDEAARASILGDYVGTVKQTVGGTVMEDPDNVARILSQKNGKFSVILPEKVAGEVTKGMEMPQVTLNDVEITRKSETTCTFHLDAFNVTAGDMTLSFKGVDGTINLSDATLALDYEMKPGKMPMYVGVSFLGKKKAAQPEAEVPSDLSQCVKADAEALQKLAKANPQLGIEGNNPADWKNLNIVWEKNEAGAYAVSSIEIKAETQLSDLALRFDAKTDATVFSALKEIKIANAGVKELVVIDQPALETVSLNGLDAAPLTAVDVQGGMALQHITLENLPQATSVFIGGDSLLTVTLNNLPSLQEQSQLSFRRLYTEDNIKDTRIEKLTLKGNLNKLNGLYLSDLGIKELALETTLPEATSISLNKNKLTGALNLKGFAKLTNLNLRNNQLETINVSECPMLKEFDASTNKQLTSLNLDLSSLTHLDASESSLTALDITHLKALKNLSVSNSKLATLTFDGTNAALERINLSGNQLTSFVLPAEVTEPYQIYLSNNRLKTLNVQHADYLEELYISNNDLDTFVAPEAKDMLGTLDCGGNHFTATFLRSLESSYEEWSELLAAPQTILGRVDAAKRQVNAKEEVALGMEPYVVKWNGEGWDEITTLTHVDGIFTLPADGTYRVICTEDVFDFIIYNMEFSFEAPYLIGEVK